MRVLHIINSVELGGAESFLLRLIQAQEKLGYTCFLLLLNPQKNDLSYYKYWKENSSFTELNLFKDETSFFSKNLYKIDSIIKSSLGLHFKEYRKKKYYQRLFQLHQFDIVNTHGLSADFFTFFYLRKFINFRWVLTSQGCYNDFGEVNKITQMIPFINGMTYVAEKNLRIFHQTGLSLTQNKKLIFNGLSKDLRVVYKNRKDFGLSHEDFVIGQITRSIPEKGMEISILATLALIEKGYHHVKLIVMGPENEYYLSLKNKYTSPNILFLGSTREPLAYVNLFDVGILPSYFPSESCPSTIVEYLAGNKPVIATNIGEIPNMIKTNNDLAGILVEEKDALGLPSIEHFSLAIEQYLLNNNLYTKHKSLCALAFEKFELEKIVEEYELIYKNSN